MARSCARIKTDAGSLRINISEHKPDPKRTRLIGVSSFVFFGARAEVQRLKVMISA